MKQATQREEEKFTPATTATFGQVTVLDFGKRDTRQTFIKQPYVYTVGYKSKVTYLSCIDPTCKTQYTKYFDLKG
jgi:hypothetical protein